MIWDILYHDLNSTKKSWFLQRIALNLEYIIPLLTDEIEIPITDIWEEVEKYTYALFEASSLQSYNSINFDAQITQDTPPQAIADLLMIHVDNPVRISKNLING